MCAPQGYLAARLPGYKSDEIDGTPAVFAHIGRKTEFIAKGLGTQQ